MQRAEERHLVERAGPHLLRTVGPGLHADQYRRSGIDLVGDIPWGTHFCQLYQTGDELLEVLVPFFRQGLLDNEYCLWITSDPVPVDDALCALRRVVPDLPQRISEGQLDVLDYRDWYLRDGQFDAETVLERSTARDRALQRRGFAGMRISGNAAWLDPDTWQAFCCHESHVNASLRANRVLVACSYSASQCGAFEIFDLVGNHEFALIKRPGRGWEVIESPEHRHAAAARREVEWRQKAILDTIPEPAWLKSADGRLLAVNAAWCQYLGQQRDEVLGKPIFEVFPAELAAKFHEQDDHVMRSRTRMRYEETMADGFGRESWFETVKSPLYNSDGQVVGIAGLARDITVRKQAEAFLIAQRDFAWRLAGARQSAAMARLCLDAALAASGLECGGIYVVDPVTRQLRTSCYRGLSDDFIEHVACAPPERPVHEVSTNALTREQVETFGNAIAAREGLSWIVPIPVIHEGRLIACLNVGSRRVATFPQQTRTVLEAMAAQMAGALARAQAVEALHESERKHRTLYEAMIQGAFVQSAAGALQDVNPAALQMLGLSRDEFLGRTSHSPQWDIIREDGTALSGPEHPSMVALTTGQPVTNLVVGILNPRTRQRVWMEVSATPEFHAGETRPFQVLVTCHDITRRKLAEQEKLEMERRLLHAQKMESLGVLAGGIAHDFNNILSAILGYTELLKRSLPPTTQAHEDLDVIRQAAQRAADLTRQMLAFSGKASFPITVIDMSRVVEEARKMLEVSVSKKATLVFHLATDLPGIEADATRIHQVVLNLVTNASDALGDHSGRIDITTDATYLSHEELATCCGNTELPPGPCIRLTVRDNGCGMDGDTISKVFDPFFTTKVTGHGLGLAAVQGIIRGHRGAIRVTSAPGEGTKFEIFFPASHRDVANTKLEKPVPRAKGGGLVLVADDEVMVRNLARRTLELAGFSVVTAADGEEALQVFTENRTQLTCVLLDLSMPKMDGLETLRIIRETDPDLRAVLCSGYPAEAASRRFGGVGVSCFIQKPFQIDALIAAVSGATSDVANPNG
jgi:PAS domain S-box-containing protein